LQRSNKLKLKSIQIDVNLKVITSSVVIGCFVFSIIGIHLIPISATPNNWSTGTDMPTPRSEAAYASLGTKIYVIGGAGNTSPGNKKIVEAYDPSSKTWTTDIAPLPVALNHPAADSYNGKIYVVGGYLDDRVPTNKLFIYDPVENTWNEGASMPTVRAALTAKFINGILYAVGGANSNFKKLNTNEAYDPSTNTWSTKAPMPTARNHLSSAVVDDKLYAIGGRTSGPSGNLNTNEAYDPSTNTWSTKAPMPTARGGLASAVVNGNIYSFGGEAPTFVFDTNEKYDTATNSWSTEASLPTARHGLTAVVSGSDIYLMGGGLEPTTSKPATGVNDIFHSQVQSPPPEEEDTESPQITIASPSNGSTITASSSGVTIDIAGSSSDNDGGSQVNSVEVQLDNDEFSTATPNSPGDWSQWTTSKTITTDDSHTITAKATDNAGNTKSSTVEIDVVVEEDETTAALIYSVPGTNSYSTLATGDSDRAGEILTSTSSLVGKSINEITVTLKKSGTPSGTISVLVRSGQDDSLVIRFGTIDSSELTASDKSFTLKAGSSHILKSKDKVVVEWSGTGSNADQVLVKRNGADAFDGTNTYLVGHKGTSYTNSNSRDLAGDWHGPN
jgi:N-acetylneuraminic acid mutarotase